MQLGYTGEAEWHPEASSRGDAKQPRDVRTQEGGADPRGRLHLALAFWGFTGSISFWQESVVGPASSSLVELELPSGLQRPPQTGAST
jgi:hypothetical protein